jgi:5'-nucleotidase
MHILVTNDDGVSAPGLASLARAMRSLGSVTVLAPDRNWSASGHVKTMHRPLRVIETMMVDGQPAFACDGAPSDCVALALLGFVQGTINLVVSGINPNANIGHDVTYSGTVTAAMEACIGGLPGIAFSLDRPEWHQGPLDYEPASEMAKLIAGKVLAEGLPEGIFLNVNVPGMELDQIKGLRTSKQGKRVYRDSLETRMDPHGRPYYWIGGDAPTGVAVEGSEYAALQEGYVSITPLQLDLTANDLIPTLRRWTWQGNLE